MVLVSAMHMRPARLGLTTALVASFTSAVAFAAPVALAMFFASATIACGSDEQPYKAAPAWSGKRANLPAPPTLPATPVKTGDAYTIFGAIHHLRSRIHEKEVNGKEISITGYIVDSNIPTAPLCAVHPAGKKDPDDCKDIPIPAFAITDAKGADPKAQRIRVLGWASNFANVFEADKKYKNLKAPPKELYKDELWAVDVPFPLPANGAKVKVTGKYGYTFGKSSAGLVSEPLTGVMTYTKIDVLEPAPERAALPRK
jgi:hypothetical protein